MEDAAVLEGEAPPEPGTPKGLAAGQWLAGRLALHMGDCGLGG